MGFKCPVCKKDFGKDHNEWKNHVEAEHSGVGRDIVALLKNIAGDNHGKTNQDRQ